MLIASGLRYDLAVRSPAYVKELVTHHVGGYLKIAPEHTEQGPLSKMMKPGMGAYDRFKALFDRYSREAGKEQYLIPYFIAAHPGTRDQDMLELALWLSATVSRRPGTDFPAFADGAGHRDVSQRQESAAQGRPRQRAVSIPKGLKIRRLQGIPALSIRPTGRCCAGLKRIGALDLIGGGKHHLIPPGNRRYRGHVAAAGCRAVGKRGRMLTQHTGLPPLPRGGSAALPGGARAGGKAAAKGRGGRVRVPRSVACLNFIRACARIRSSLVLFLCVVCC